MLVLIGLIACAGCGGGGGSSPGPLAAADTNLVFVVSPDLAFQGAGDVDPRTGNLTSQGLQRSLEMASFLASDVLGGANVRSIIALEPMTHLQTSGAYPDMAGIGYIQQFALMNQTTLQGTTAYSYPLAVSYGPHSVPPGVAEPASFEGLTQGLAFGQDGDDNLDLAARILHAREPGFYVFSAPWETTRALLAGLVELESYEFRAPESYAGPNAVFAIAVSSAGRARLERFDAAIDPPVTYPVLPSPVPPAACDQQQPFVIERTAGVDGVVVPANANTNETVYLMRHAEAHPGGENWDDGNYIGTGQWRALALPDVMRDKIAPDEVWSIDPAQAFEVGGINLFSYVRPALTVWPYTVATGLPYKLAAGFALGSADDANAAQATIDQFFAGGALSGKKVLLAWEHAHFPPLIQALVASYGGSAPAPSVDWPSTDYDTIWTVSLDGAGNLRVDNALCEGIDTSGLGGAPPAF
ncbi:MAG: hypothetical protein U0610_29680 [bacterium]